MIFLTNRIIIHYFKLLKHNNSLGLSRKQAILYKIHTHTHTFISIPSTVFCFFLAYLLIHKRNTWLFILVQQPIKCWAKNAIKGTKEKQFAWGEETPLGDLSSEK
jgi:hypothetical protein